MHPLHVKHTHTHTHSIPGVSYLNRFQLEGLEKFFAWILGQLASYQNNINPELDGRSQ